MNLRHYPIAILSALLLLSSSKKTVWGFSVTPPIPELYIPQRTEILDRGWESIVDLAPLSILPVGGSPFLKDTLLNAPLSGGWNFFAAPQDLAGSFDLFGYTAEITPIDGQLAVGASLKLTYNPGAGDPDDDANLFWIQSIFTTAPAAGAFGPTYIDNGFNLEHPFYGGRKKMKDNSLKKTNRQFEDGVFRSNPWERHQWYGELYLAELTAPKTVTIHNGISWGWQNTWRRRQLKNPCSPDVIVVAGSGGGGVGNEGLTQDEPLLATAITPAGEQIFCQVPPRSWYDPPTNYGFEFEALDGTLFTDILDFPVGEDDRFTVEVGDFSLGEFGPGDRVDFVERFGTGLSFFRITDIDPLVSGQQETFFPIKLDFNTSEASFIMRPLFDPNEVDPRSTPEAVVPWAVLMLGAIGLSLFGGESQHQAPENEE